MILTESEYVGTVRVDLAVDTVGKLTIPQSVTYIGKTYAVTAIGDYAFENRAGLTGVIIPDSVTSVGNAAFIGCSSLAEVTIGSGVKIIGSGAFQGCTSLTGVTIPESVTVIGPGAFSSCASLTSFNVASGNVNFSSDGGVLLNNRKTALISYPSASGNCVIPDGVASIGDFAFSGCSSLMGVTVPDGVASIGYRAFSGCTGLQSVNIPEGVTSIGEEAFSFCQSLVSVDMPGSVNIIGDMAFSGCTKLAGMVIPNSVTAIAAGTFYSCTSLTDVTIPKSVTSIGGSAFGGCTGLTELTLSDSVTDLGDFAFYGCRSLSRVTIPDGVMSIGRGMLYACTSLTEVTIPQSVESIGEEAFYACTSLKSVFFDGDAPEVGVSALSLLAVGAIACVYRDAGGFPEEGNLWNRLVVAYRDGVQPSITSLNTGRVTTLVSGCEAVLPVNAEGKNLAGTSLVFSILNAEGVVVYTSEPLAASDSFSGKLRIAAETLTLPAGTYSVRASVKDGEAFLDCPLMIAAPNLDDCWKMDVLKGVYGGADALELRFADGFVREFNGEVFVNGMKFGFVADGGSVFVPGAPVSGDATVKITRVMYPVLFPSYTFTFSGTAAL